ncbi:unnamed protein product [Urochloa decumbens]|uniref:F-box domain-containing protein n=1 Tax=Urochloa decumbens TaxID=240449 RepID=A0ABC9AHY8_9POAL
MQATDTVAAPPPALPDDVLEDILSRLPARSLAASRRVCKAWRDVVDERQLLAPAAAPPTALGARPLRQLQRLLARPSTTSINGKFSFITREKPFGSHTVLNHCNGLVLDSGDRRSAMYVCNPMTRRWVCLPPHHDDRYQHQQRRTFLVFDPAVSPAQWEVLMAPLEPHKEKAAKDMEPEERMMEWPPAMWRWSVVSSIALEWEEKVFVRVGEAAGTVAELLMHELDDELEPQWRYGAYCHGALYMHCRGEFISRLSLSTSKYRVIKSPIDLAECHGGEDERVLSSIGKSGNRVCFAALDGLGQLRVWMLNESGEETKWLLKHHSVVNLRYEQMTGDGP